LKSAFPLRPNKEKHATTAAMSSLVALLKSPTMASFSSLKSPPCLMLPPPVTPHTRSSSAVDDLGFSLVVKAGNALMDYNRVMNSSVHCIAQGTILKHHFDVDNDLETEQFVENGSCAKRSGKRMHHMASNDNLSCKTCKRVAKRISQADSKEMILFTDETWLGDFSQSPLKK
jgi:hypothetical protein